MKKIIFPLIFIFFIAAYLLITKKNCPNKQAKTYLIENKNYCLLSANNSEEWEKGLMFYKKPVDFDGMIFIFTDKQMRSFWNKNTYVDLDIYWMDGEKAVGKSYLPSILKTKEPLTVKSPKEVDRVVEIIR